MQSVTMKTQRVAASKAIAPRAASSRGLCVRVCAQAADKKASQFSVSSVMAAGLAAVVAATSLTTPLPALAYPPKFYQAAEEREAAINKELAVLEYIIQQQEIAKKASISAKRQELEKEVAVVENKIQAQINEEKAEIAALSKAEAPAVAAPAAPAVQAVSAPVSTPEPAAPAPAPVVAEAPAVAAAPAVAEAPIVVSAPPASPALVQAEAKLEFLEQQEEKLQVFAAKAEETLDRQEIVAEAEAASNTQALERTAQVFKDDISEKIENWLDSIAKME